MKTFILSSLNMAVRYILLSSLLWGYAVAGIANDQNNDEVLSQAELEQMLAPIALYPDTVLSHVLIASTYPLEVVLANRWVQRHPDLKGDEAINAVEEDWDPSVIALVAFPDLLERMSDDLDWTEGLGEAFLADEARVLESIQELRRRAYDEGNLNDSEHTLITEEETRIIIEPRVREVVYLPYYDTRVVYGHWWWAGYPPVYWVYPRTHHYVHVNHVYWGPRVNLSFGFYFSSFHWSHHRVVVVDRHHWHHRPHYSRHTIIHHRHARPWRHEVRHRRGVNYRHHRVAERYNSVSRDAATRDTTTRDTMHHVRRSDGQTRSRHEGVQQRLSNNRQPTGKVLSGDSQRQQRTRSKEKQQVSEQTPAVHSQRNGDRGARVDSRQSSKREGVMYSGSPVGQGQTLDQRRPTSSRGSQEKSQPRHTSSRQHTPTKRDLSNHGSSRQASPRQSRDRSSARSTPSQRIER